MRKKFVQIASLALVIALILVMGVSAVWAPHTENPSVLGSQIMRIGIYYGTSGKSSAALTTVTGDGFQLGYYDSNDNFYSVLEVPSRNLTVQSELTSTSAITVWDTDTGMLLYQFDGVSGAALGIQPVSYTGVKTVVKCGYPYYGNFRFQRFSANNELMTIVNLLPLDDYVKGVVPYESSPSWPLEALKAQTVCARTYALTHINSSHQRNYNFDLCDSTCCQAYKGVYSGSYAAQIDAAVDGTSGLTVMYNGEYCDTVYSSSNGGGSESAVNVWGRDVPYLIGKEDPYEATVANTISNYNWSKSFTGAELQARLIEAGYSNCGVITEVQTTLSSTGNVITLTFIDANGRSWSIYNTTGGGSRCRTFLSLRSLHYTVSSNGQSTTGGTTSGGSGITVNGNQTVDPTAGMAVIDGTGSITYINEGYVVTANGVEAIGASSSSSGGGTVSGATGSVFTFNGTGWGHNVGLSQYGAYAMAQMGYTFRQILEFYYTGVTIA